MVGDSGPDGDSAGHLGGGLTPNQEDGGREKHARQAVHDSLGRLRATGEPGFGSRGRELRSVPAGMPPHARSLLDRSPQHAGQKDQRPATPGEEADPGVGEREAEVGGLRVNRKGPFSTSAVGG